MSLSEFLKLILELPAWFWRFLLLIFPWGRPLEIGRVRHFVVNGHDWYRVYVHVTRPWGVEGVKLTLTSIIPLGIADEADDFALMLRLKDFAVGSGPGIATTSIVRNDPAEFDVVTATIPATEFQLNFSTGNTVDPRCIPSGQYRLTLKAHANGIRAAERDFELSVLDGRVVLAPSQAR